MNFNIKLIWLCALLGFLSPACFSAEIKMNRTDLLFDDDFEDGDLDGWALTGRGSSAVTEYEGNHSLNLSRTRTAQVTVSVEDFHRIDISMQLAAMNLADGETCSGEISTNEGKKWQPLLTVTPQMADGVTLHPKSGQLRNSGSMTNILLRFRSDGGRKANCWGDNVEVIGKKKN